MTFGGWKFRGLGDLADLSTVSIRSGTEIYSRLTRDGRPRVTPKRKLTVFWLQENLTKRAGHLIGPQSGPRSGVSSTPHGTLSRHAAHIRLPR